MCVSDTAVFTLITGANEVLLTEGRAHHYHLSECVCVCVRGKDLSSLCLPSLAVIVCHVLKELVSRDPQSTNEVVCLRHQITLNKDPADGQTNRDADEVLVHSEK